MSDDDGAADRGLDPGAGETDARSLDTSAVPDYDALARLDGRRVLIAGAGQGIGRQVAHALAQAGARLTCLDHDREAAEHVAEEVGGTPLVADARDRDDIERAVSDTVDALGGLDGVVDIVGMARYGPLLETSDEDWDWTFDMVLRHAFLLAQIGGRVIAENADGGAMCFIASVSGITGSPWHAAYGAAKAALMSLVRSTAVELAGSGVRVNAVAPGFVWTPRVAAFVGEEGRQRNVDNTPLGRIAEPSDIAGPVRFLMSDLAGFVTGRTIVVDGGVGVKFPYPLG